MPDFSDPQVAALTVIVAGFAAFTVTLAAVASWSRGGKPAPQASRADTQDKRRSA